MSQSPESSAGSSGVSGNARQLLGMKGACGTSSIWKLRLQLMKPVTWIPLIWGVICGAAASGNFHWTLQEVGASVACMLMSGPLLAGYTQTLNDYYDREIDAINEPYRPIPSGAIPLGQVRLQILVLLLAGLAVAWGLDRWAGHTTPVLLLLALGGSFVSYIYSAPPLKLKQNGWLGNYALGASYIALPWWAGQALFGQLTWPTALLTLAYSLAGLGIAVVNDFKSVEGDRALGLQSLPVVFGIERASWISAGMIDVLPARHGGGADRHRSALRRRAAGAADRAPDHLPGHLAAARSGGVRRQVPGQRPALPGPRHACHRPGDRPQ